MRVNCEIVFKENEIISYKEYKIINMFKDSLDNIIVIDKDNKKHKYSVKDFLYYLNCLDIMHYSYKLEFIENKNIKLKRS